MLFLNKFDERLNHSNKKISDANVSNLKGKAILDRRKYEQVRRTDGTILSGWGGVEKVL